jgi:hypothetical protein
VVIDDGHTGNMALGQQGNRFTHGVGSAHSPEIGLHDIGDAHMALPGFGSACDQYAPTAVNEA